MITRYLDPKGYIVRVCVDSFRALFLHIDLCKAL